MFLLSHLIWILATQQEKPIAQPDLKLSTLENYQEIQIPIQNFAPIPEQGERREVSLFSENGHHQIKGYLREVTEDPLGTTGEKAIVEVHKKDLLKVKDQRGIWFVYPPIIKTQNSKGVVNEIRF